MNELDVMRVVSERLERLALPYMLTGSFALAHYATPRMTRDIDLVVALQLADVARTVAAFTDVFYVDADAVASAVRHERLFNLMHLQSGIKVDLIVRKSSLYRQAEFERRQRVEFAGVKIFIVTREDLILSKLVWAQTSGSELQQRDVAALLDATVDLDYLRRWASELGVQGVLEPMLR